MPHDRLEATEGQREVNAACECGSWRCRADSAQAVGVAWDRHRERALRRTDSARA